MTPPTWLDSYGADLQNPPNSSPKSRRKQQHAPPEITAAATNSGQRYRRRVELHHLYQNSRGAPICKSPMVSPGITAGKPPDLASKVPAIPHASRHFFPSNWPSTPVPKGLEDAGEQNPTDLLQNNRRKRRARQFENSAVDSNSGHHVFR